MRTLRPLLAGAIALAMSGSLSLSAAAQSDVSAGDVTVVEDLVYAMDRADEGAESKLDLYLGAGGDEAPLVVHVPGQYMARGSQLPRALAERGATVLVVDGPRPSPEAAIGENGQKLREMVETVACAVRFARGSEYGSETAPLLLSGFSYGGWVASHVALAGEDFTSLWEQFGETAGGPPGHLDCAVSEASTRVDAFVGVAGTYLGYGGIYGDDYMVEHAPALWALLQGTVGMQPELKVRLLAGDSDWLPYEVPATFEAVLAEAGYDVKLTEFAGGHVVPLDLTVDTVMDLLHT